MRNKYRKQAYNIYDYRDKARCINNHLDYLLIRTNNIFKYNNLPDTIPEHILELQLQTNGNCCITEVDGELYSFTGGLGGEPNAYFMPTIYTVANPFLKFNKNLKIDKECILIQNDSLLKGLYELLNRYSTALTENELSLYLTSINTRIQQLITAGDDISYDSAKKFIKDIELGESGVIADNSFIEGIKSLPMSNQNNNLTNLIEYEQYLKASLYNEIGLNANYNMKRESLNSAESQLNNDALTPLIDDMLKNRKKGVEKVNAMYGTNITVDYNSAWKDNEEEREMLIDSSEDKEEETTDKGVEENASE